MHRRRVLGWTTLGLVIVLLPLWVTGTYPRHLLIMFGVFAILALSLNLVLGFLGENNLGQAAFFGIGAYASALVATKAHFPFLGSLAVAVIIAAAFGMAIGFVSLRIKGPHFAMITLGLGQILYQVANNWVEVTRGPMGITRIPPPNFGIPGVGSFSIQGEAGYYYLMVILLGICIFVTTKFIHSRPGRAAVAIRENEALAQSLGIDTFRYKMLAFTLATIFAGVAGSLYAHYVRFISPEMMGLYYTFNMVMMVVVGGQGTVVGPILGAALFTFASEWLRVVGDYRLIVFGTVFILSIVFMPLGIYPTIHDLWFRILTAFGVGVPKDLLSETARQGNHQ